MILLDRADSIIPHLPISRSLPLFVFRARLLLITIASITLTGSSSAGLIVDPFSSEVVQADLTAEGMGKSAESPSRDDAPVIVAFDAYGNASSSWNVHENHETQQLVGWLGKIERHDQSVFIWASAVSSTRHLDPIPIELLKVPISLHC